MSIKDKKCLPLTDDQPSNQMEQSPFFKLSGRRRTISIDIEFCQWQKTSQQWNKAHPSNLQQKLIFQYYLVDILASSPIKATLHLLFIEDARDLKIHFWKLSLIIISGCALIILHFMQVIQLLLTFNFKKHSDISLI